MGTRTLLTVAEFEKLPDDGNRHELDEGELVAMPPPQPIHGRVQKRVAVVLDNAVAGVGGVVLTETGFRVAVDVVQAPDVSFIVDEKRITWDRYCEFGPDLAVEVLSPDDNAARLQRKIARYFAAGTRVVWVLDPEAITATVYEKNGSFRTLGATDMIAAPDLLPGFSAPVSSLFE